MAYVKETFRAPGILEVKKYHTWRWGGKCRRGANIKRSDRKQRKRNSKNSREYLARLIMTNFTKGDMRVDLTYGGAEPDAEEAKKNIDNFLQRARRLYKKKGEELKFILATEHKQHRIHHHLLINFIKGKIEEDDIAALWPYSKLNYRSTRKFDGGPEDARRLAWYITKETDKTIGDEDSIQKVRYRCSRNLMKPDVKKEVIYSRKWAESPKPPKGYTVYDTEEGATEDGFPFQIIRMKKDITDKEREKWNRKMERWEHHLLKGRGKHELQSRSQKSEAGRKRSMDEKLPGKAGAHGKRNASRNRRRH